MYLTITTPDGLLFGLNVPVEGPCHELTLVKQFTWKQILESVLEIDNNQYYVYADSALMLKPFLMVPFGAVGADEMEMELNWDMCPVRVAVEWNEKNVKL